MFLRRHAQEPGPVAPLQPIDRRRALQLAPAVGVAFLLVLSSGGRAAANDVSWRGSMHARVLEVPDAALTKTLQTRSAGSFVGGPTTASTGETVNVYVSSTLSTTLGTPQSWADFIAGLLHGLEISSLTAYIATYDEMRELCGSHALGCYSGNRMVSMGETVYGVTAAEVVRHEYGHHIALNRLNTPWQAVDWGPKHWATAIGVCRRVEQGAAFPGDGRDNYSLNPGEAWAETYRVLVERRGGTPEAPWEIVSPSFYPDEVALAAAERDVVQPWTGPTRTTYRTRFTRSSRKSWTIPLETPRDGAIRIEITLPRGGLHDAVLLEQDGTVATALWSGRTLKTVSTTVCGQRSLRLRVTHKGTFGRVSVSASIP